MDPEVLFLTVFGGLGSDVGVMGWGRFALTKMSFRLGFLL